MKPRQRALWAVLAWLLIILVGTGARLINFRSDDAQRDEQAWELLQEHFSDSSRRAAQSQLEELITVYDQGLDGFIPIPARLFPTSDLSPQRQSGLLNRGREHGIKVGQGVIGRRGVVGAIAEVSRTSSRIIFSDDPDFRVSFSIRAKGRGVAAGGPRRGQLHPILRLESLQFQVGDLLVTSGTDGVFPRSLVVGTVRTASLPIEWCKISPPPDIHEPQEVLVLALPTLQEDR